MSEPLFCVTLPDGRKTKPYSRKKIVTSLETGQIPQEATVDVNGVLVNVGEFFQTSSTPPRTAQAVSAAGDAEETSPVPITQAPIKEYKVLTQKDKWFSGKFDPATLEEALNAYAEQGWVVKAATTAAITGILTGNRDEMIIILER